MSHLLDGLKLGHKVALQADSHRILRFCQGADSLRNGKSASGIPELAYFNHWQEVQEFSETGEGGDLKTWVKLIEEHGTTTITKAINSLTMPSHADYVVSTAHKSKGLEWNRVQISDDFYMTSTHWLLKLRLKSYAYCMWLVHEAKPVRHSSHQRSVACSTTQKVDSGIITCKRHTYLIILFAYLHRWKG